VSRFYYSILLTIIGLVAVNTAKAQEPVLVGGMLTADQTWTKNYIYIVTDDVRVPQNITLTIESGVTVRFNQGTGLSIEMGHLLVNGQENDTVMMVPNYIGVQNWKWKGVTFQKAGGAGNNHISYARIVNAEVGIELTSSDQVVIENCYLSKNQWRGIRFVSSSNCRVIKCDINQNYVGIELYASGAGNQASGNLIDSCYIGNNNSNIILLNDTEGKLSGNLIQNNVIEKGLNGIRIDRGNNAFASVNTFSMNKVISNGQGVGFGIYVTMDSTLITNNIFWLNNNALTLRDAADCRIENNSFLKNFEGVNMQSGAARTIIEGNTLVKNENRIITFNHSPQGSLQKNNLFKQQLATSYIRNNTADDMVMPNNYWTTSDSDTIDTFIWDRQDNPLLGQVLYTPVADEPDTTAPMSPPDHFIKQLINGKVVFSWKENPESDLVGYRLHYGTFNRYTFAQHTIITDTTTFTLSGVTVFDSIAITALDNQGAVSGQCLGHESPFVFAAIRPYAGPDTLMCKSQSSIDINNSTIPFLFDQLTWLTSGDGVFDDESVLYPNYYPGNLDHSLGRVTITMEVVRNASVYTDSFQLLFIESPLAWAGNDTILSPDSILALQQAMADYYDELLWSTTGDGSFTNSSALVTEYLPGPEDKFNGGVNLILTASSDCGLVRDTLRLNIKQLYRISGTAWSELEQAVDGVVMAVLVDEPGPAAAAIAPIEQNGGFHLNNMLKGKYLLYAVPDTVAGNQLSPAYYLNEQHWQSAYVFDLQSDVFDVDIQLESLLHKNNSGQGLISGRFLMSGSNIGDEVYCQPWFSQPETDAIYCQEGLANASILLYNPNKTALIDYALTDIDGYFYFDSLPFGQYRVDAEKPGYQSIGSDIITLNQEAPVTNNLILKIDEQKISFYQTQAVARTEDVVLFPNPVSGLASCVIEGMDDAEIHMHCFDLLGRVQNIGIHEKTIAGASRHFELDLEKLSRGIYVIRIESSQFNRAISLVKN